MSRLTQDLLRKNYTIHRSHQEMVDSLMKKWGLISESEVVRAAIMQMYKKWDPGYLQPSAREKERLERQKAELEEQEMPDEQYATEVLHGVLKKDKDGKSWVLTHRMGNTLYCTPLDKVKTFAMQEDGWYLNYNLAELAKGRSIEKSWQLVKDTFIARHNLVEDGEEKAI